MVTESLTKYRMGIMKEAKSKFGNLNVYSSDGRIVVVVKSKKYFVTSKEQFLNIPAAEQIENPKSHTNTNITVRKKI